MIEINISQTMQIEDQEVLFSLFEKTYTPKAYKQSDSFHYLTKNLSVLI